jgi:hypothetical protein
VRSENSAAAIVTEIRKAEDFRRAALDLWWKYPDFDTKKQKNNPGS